ncbi:hypothetical protein PS6_006848 [Mucor atramentarius]
MGGTLPEFYARRATLDDLKYVQQITDLFNEAFGSKNSKLIYTIGGWASISTILTNYSIKRDVFETFITESVAGNMMHILLFQRDEQGNDKAAVGTLTVEKDGLLGRFAVDVGFLSRGLGKILMGFALEEMKRSGYSDCTLHVFENRTDLINWYRKLGFVDTMERIRFHPPEGVIFSDNEHLFAVYKKTL